MTLRALRRRTQREDTALLRPIADLCSLRPRQIAPRDEVLFSVYEGPSVAAVRQLNEHAGIPASRIVEAIAVRGDQAE
jgi:hypothetical protein